MLKCNLLLIIKKKKREDMDKKDYIETYNEKITIDKKKSEAMDKKKTIKFIGITFAMAWTIQIIVSYLFLNIDKMKGRLVFQGGLMICMFTPLISALLAKADFKSMGWKPTFKGNIQWIFFSILVPNAFLLLGSALFFIVFPDCFSLDGSYIMKSFEGIVDAEEIHKALHKAGMDIKVTILITFLQCVTEVPFINMFFAIGEEVGWRGFLYPELKKNFSRVNAWLIGGSVWAAFHFPSMVIAGYEYGLEYIGAPMLGLMTFTIFCIAIGIIHEIIYDKTKSIWYPSLFHGAINGSATMVQLLLNGNQKDRIDKLFILGPAPNGLLSMIPVIVISIIMAVKVLKNDNKNVTNVTNITKKKD